MTAVDLGGLTRVELGFALVLAVAAGGLVLALGLAERRRSAAIARALGATDAHLRAFVFGETIMVATCGLVIGVVGGASLSAMLVQVLAGVFDPPPSAPLIPWAYLGVVTGLSLGALASAAVGTARAARRSAVVVMRGL